MLQRALACERMPHAYLFAGPEGVGKEMLARRLAATLLCSAPVQRPLPRELAAAIPGQLGRDACGTCQDCRLVAAGTHPDLFIIYRQLNRQHPDSTIRKQKALVLGVEIIRHFVIERAGTRPSRGRAKVFIIREAERLNEAAQNSLLKTLEEPPADTFIILLTDALDRLLPTTRSRCQEVTFQPLPSDYVAETLARLRPDASEAEARYAAAHAGGSLGGALRCVDDGLLALKQSWAKQIVERVRGGGRSAPHELAKPFMEDARTLAACITERDPDVSETDATRGGIQALLSALADVYTDALRRAGGSDAPAVNADQPEIVAALAAEGTDRLLASLSHLSEAEGNLARNAHVELTLETLFIRLARSRTVSVAG
jgi:DNA polymerase-3 subunit delta'